MIKKHLRKEKQGQFVIPTALINYKILLICWNVIHVYCLFPISPDVLHFCFAQKQKYHCNRHLHSWLFISHFHNAKRSTLLNICDFSHSSNLNFKIFIVEKTTSSWNWKFFLLFKTLCDPHHSIHPTLLLSDFLICSPKLQTAPFGAGVS